nr:uncharacterized protein LOC105105796 [Camelus dromedarius]XP_031325094.1 uncharacterized protein LOC105105796 [Camelus dromedarius]
MQCPDAQRSRCPGRGPSQQLVTKCVGATQAELQVLDTDGTDVNDKVRGPTADDPGMDPLFVAAFLTRLSAPQGHSCLLSAALASSCLAHVGPWLCFLSRQVGETHRASHGSGERCPVEAEVARDSFHLHGACGLSTRGPPPCGVSRGRGCLIMAHERGTAFLISANVTDFRRSVKSPTQGTWPVTPCDVPWCLFQHVHRLFRGRRPHGSLAPPLPMARGVSLSGESQRVPSPQTAAVPGGRTLSLLPTRCPPLPHLPRAWPLQPPDLASSPSHWLLHSPRLGFGPSGPSQRSAQAQPAHGALGDSGVTSTEPGVPRPAVEVGKG